MGMVLLQFSSNESYRSQKFFQRKKKKDLWLRSRCLPTYEYHSEMSSYTDYFYLFFSFSFQVVICKLRSESTTTERSRQHWRAAKALLVIFPLLGISYIITLVGPQEGTPGHRVFQYVRALLLSLQVSTKYVHKTTFCM